MNKLTFQISIRAPREQVWQLMLSDAGYRQWTVPFCEGSYYEGSWDAGARIRFLSPDGDGMIAVIAESRPAEFLSIKILGEIRDGVEHDADEAPAWAPAYENYQFETRDGATLVTVTTDVIAEFEDYMTKTWSLALDCLRVLCEASAKR